MFNSSLAELDTQRIIAERIGFFSPQWSEELSQRITAVRKMRTLLTLNGKLKLFS